MDHTLFSALLKNLLSVDVTDATDMDSSLYAFEKEYCFSIKMQPMFTSKALYYLLSSSKESMIYELIDQLGICLSFFTFDNRFYIIGPYVKEKYSELKTETVLAKNDESSSKSLAFKLYYTAFPIVYTEQITSVVNKCIISFSPTESEYSYRRLSGFIQDVSEEDDKTELSEKNYSEIYRRYDQEKQFLSMIRNGDTKNILSAFEKLSGPEALSDFSKETLNYYASGYGLAILKALSRKAAEESGLSVITIDEITQKYTQLSSATNNAELQTRYQIDMIVELTKAVHNHKLSLDKYSPPIQRVMEYINLHLGDHISNDDLAANASMSISHLSKVFKKETGGTMTEYIALMRCKKAAGLLKKTDLPVQEISSYVGYSDNNYFVKVFKKIYDLTPSEYRKTRIVSL
ncbi:transcriptional regulator AraC family [Butyrivibrio proteoclasticus B316]|uniref:Transcriptional regulator AraC family n=1 Tax=Butyrivibrio proteoclasticus (strain ATCC 51982 / DSM 14932 / B316) TaxID=515622 RepID=E0RXJ9_BUTPB|nr:AraC family transcriptional regulator [Butyrivibrio proteoclasticus]ADL34426.1 transcriptional regulator AraC family [Butyrivibrio proteoclasticus B316]